MRAIGYVRVSTDRQDLSLSAQQEKIRAMAVVKGAELVDLVVDEDESGKSLDRPGVKRILELVRRRQVDAVIITKLDRLTRNVRDAYDLVDLFNRKEVVLVSLAESLDTGSASGRMVLNVMAAFAQMEREVIGERTSAALQQKRRRGERAGNIPYGYRVVYGGRLEEDPKEQGVIREIREMRTAGASLRDIADALNEAGRKTRRGTPWRFQYVANVLEGK